MLPRLEIVRRLRPVELVSSPRISTVEGGSHPLPALAPYVAATTTLASPTSRSHLALHVGGTRLGLSYDGSALSLVTTRGHDTREHRSRRMGGAESPTELGLTLTGTHLTAWSRERGRWVARARRDLRDDLDVGVLHDEEALASLTVELPDQPSVAGGFGQLGLRDLRLVSEADGTPVRDEGDLWLSATSAGPGFFDSAHTSLWRLSPETLELRHTGDLYFRRPDHPGAYGDHATHVVRDGDRWLVATSTWGDFEQPTTRADRTAPSRLRVTLASVDGSVDLLRGERVLDTVELPLPTDGFTSVAVWDPHLLRDGDRWLVGFVSASRFFRFHPALAAGPSLDDLALVAAAPDRRATEGTTLLRVDGELLVLASDGRDGRRGERARFPVFGTDLVERGALDAPYPTNLPWPTLAHVDGGWLMVAFNGAPAGGRLLGYGTHGDVVVMREPD
ncbi:hypothetical protein [Nocardioides sp. Soil805]|uniref:hypothetical protein n=1 Tax=Nocardioides sp. Soil805 TaxID=1736416 RepID=UPI0007035A4A|nr:hypothetical protein [Nocardioides sp. Soil805]KRF34989.1 hypothetical protein ASG94_12685 [Nocardioides sp. Soil805]